MVPFFIIFVFYTLAIAIGFDAMRENDDFLLSWTKAFRLSYGDFEDIDAYVSTGEIVTFHFGCILLPLILLNLLIAVMGDIYANEADKKEIEDTKERLLLIQEIYYSVALFSKIKRCLKCKKFEIKRQYIHHC